MLTFWYFPLEPLESRYTKQLCEEWIPPAIEAFKGSYKVSIVVGDVEPNRSDIRVGVVLDAVGRGLYALSQVSRFLKAIEAGTVGDGDIVYLQDFWTPGLEAIFYALDLYGLKGVRFYAMLHAQSVDEFDFTYAMLPWIRDFELGIAKRMAGVFVASTIHYNQLKKAGFTCPIHVVNLPFNYAAVRNKINGSGVEKEKRIVFCSRLDDEKDPLFMLDVASKFLKRHPDYSWHVLTSSKRLRSSNFEITKALQYAAINLKGFYINAGLSKELYYKLLAQAQIIFNSSKQDYVSWTLLEASAFGCDLCYPDFRSFPECVPHNRLYKPGDPESAVLILEQCLEHPQKHYYIAEFADKCRNTMVRLMFDNSDREVNVWLDGDSFHGYYYHC